MNRILLDTNVVLDLYLDREPFAGDAAILWAAHEEARIVAYVSAITPVNLYYIASKLRDKTIARRAVTELLNTLRVCPIDQAILQASLQLGFKDFEDAVQSACAEAAGLDAIITRNIKDFRRATLPVFLPSDYIKQFLS